MRIKLAIPTLALLSMLLVTGHVYADEFSVPITGTAYGDKIGLLHFDYTTAIKPPAPPAPNANEFNNPNYYIGPTKQFYISPYTATAKNPYFTGPGDETITARVGTAPTDCDTTGCQLRGFIWSDTIGWIALDGNMIGAAIDEATGIPGSFPSTLYPRIKKTGAMIGYAWNRHAGWISLASNIVNGTTTPAIGQTESNFGVWISASVTPTTLGGEDVGRPLHGYVWSENLGWIKFGIESNDVFAFDFQAYTRWAPDDTSPIILSPDKVWFSVGVNTGYDPVVGSPTFNGTASTIIWKGFAIDPESGANKVNSKITISPIPNPGGTDADCPAPPSESVVKLSQSLSNSYLFDLNIPVIGNLQNVKTGYCKYKLNAKILNGGNNLPTYIGSQYIPLPPAPMPAASQLMKPDGIIVYVRAGNPDIKVSRVTPTKVSATALADGRESFGYKVDLKDVAGNPIQDIHCGLPYTSAGNPQFQEDDCPNREVTVTANLTNSMLFDLTQAAPLSPYTTPIKVDDVNPESGTPLLNTDASVEVYLDSLAYNLLIASYAPTSSYSAVTPTTPITKQFLVDQFEYRVDNESPLPATTSKLSGPGPYTTASPLIADADSVVPAYEIDKTHTDMRTGGSVGQQVSPKGFSDSQMTYQKPYMDLTGADPQSIAGTIQSNDPTTFIKPLNIVFTPAITTGNAEIDSGGQKNILTNAVPADLKFNVLNTSSKAIAIDQANGGLSIDNIFKYGPASNPFTALMETHRIIGLSESEIPEEKFAWTNPLESTSDAGDTRYEIYDGECYALRTCGPLEAEPCVTKAQCDATNSPFRGIYQTRHINKDFCYDDIAPDTCMPPNNIREDGTYAISGAYSIPQEFAPLKTDPITGEKTYPDGEIDRSDMAALDMIGTANPALPTLNPKSIQFTPEKFVSATVTGAELELLQDIAYRFPDQLIASVYTTSLKKGLKVLDIGLQAKGTVSGPQIVTDRKFDTVGSESTKKLQEQVRRNVAQLISGMDRTGCALKAGDVTELSEFETSGPCYIHDDANKTAFKYYEGGPDETLVLGDGTTDPLFAPEFPYTIIVKGGANISILNDIAYPKDEPRSSLGFILIAGDTASTGIGKGSNVYISPEITNMVGTLYSEGSLISRNKDGETYYGGATGDIQELKNQLYWQGSIASRNTIGGAGIKKVPDGLTCEATDTQIECAQRYDLDYLRRFTAVVVNANPNVTPAVVASSAIANDGKFSGGGCCGTTNCAATVGTCILPGTLPSVVKLDGGLSGQIQDEPISQLSTTYIEREPRAAANPPPGFTVSGGQDTTQTIR